MEFIREELRSIKAQCGVIPVLGTAIARIEEQLKNLLDQERSHRERFNQMEARLGKLENRVHYVGGGVAAILAAWQIFGKKLWP